MDERHQEEDIENVNGLVDHNDSMSVIHVGLQGVEPDIDDNIAMLAYTCFEFESEKTGAGDMEKIVHTAWEAQRGNENVQAAGISCEIENAACEVEEPVCYT